jgi:glycine cleavage system aminomethyltransferase T
MGARVELRGGWRVATVVGASLAEDRGVVSGSVGWADFSHLRKLSVTGAGLYGSRGVALARGGALWCWVEPSRRLVLRESAGRAVAGGVDVTTQLGGIVVAGPAARDAIARFCALDLRPERAAAGSFLPGSVARTPGYALVLGEERFLLLYGAAYSQYLWEVVADAVESLGGRAVGVDAVGQVVGGRTRA